MEKNTKKSESGSPIICVENSIMIENDVTPGESPGAEEDESPQTKIPHPHEATETTTTTGIEVEAPQKTDLASQDSASSKMWTLYTGDMDRLTAAVKYAIAVPETKVEEPNLRPEAHSEDAAVEAQHLTVSVSDNNLKYMLPWDACRTWQRMEAFLQEWFVKDGSSLKAIEDSQFSIVHQAAGIVHPGLWNSIVKPGSHIHVDLYLPPGVKVSPPPPPPPAPDTDTEPETLYESRVQYKVSYYQRHQFDDHSHFVSESVYAEPVVLEKRHDSDKVPVLEERKNVESPPTLPGTDSDSPARTSTLRKPRLRQGDVVSEPVLKVNSPYLLNILKAVIEYSAEPPAGDNEGLDAGLFAYPYADLYLHLDDLARYKAGELELRNLHSASFNKLADEHIDLLQSYLENQPTIPFKEAKARWSGDLPLTTFGTLWLLMKPGMDVYVRESDGSISRYVLDRLSGGIFQDAYGKKTTRKYIVRLWNLILDDKAIRQFIRHVDIPIFDDERKITDLPVFPVDFHDASDGGTQHQALVDRGRKYFDYSKKPCFLQYNGEGLGPSSKPYKRARVVVEHASKPWVNGALWGPDLEHHMPIAKTQELIIRRPSPYGSLRGIPPPPPPPPNISIASVVGESIRVAHCECKECQAHATSEKTHARLKFSDYREIEPRKAAGLTDHQYSILPSHMFAFVLNDRVYDLLDVSRLEEPSMAETAIDRLVMPDGNKDLIKAVAKTYTDNSNLFSADFIYGKGEGQIILLHGPPGTGKTLTAESVAEFTKRPLLNITAADLGHEPDALESSLLQYFRRANDWDAIVLLDEADVYLEARSTSDLKRNSIVSVFLRALDYFQGILFLTTNRVGQFDEAFMSRIHLSLGYDKLNDEARAKIWDNMFQKLKDDHKSGGPKLEFDYYAKQYVEKSDEVKALKWNGREIRNAFQTAVALAVYDAKHKHNGAVPEVTEKHLRQVVSMSSAFRQYIVKTHQGKDHSTIAYQQGSRDDRTQSTSIR